MSLIVAMQVPTGLVLSGDSRSTGTISQQVPNPSAPGTNVNVQTSIVLSDATNKVFIVHKRFGVGTFGEAFVKNLPIAHHIEQYELFSANRVPASTQHLAQEILTYFRAITPILNVNFLVVGYDNTQPWLLVVNVSANSIVRQFHDSTTNIVQYGVNYGGDYAIVQRLLSQPQFNPPFDLMNLQDAVDFSRHLIRTTIDQLRFEPRFATVGGPIDSLVITPNYCEFLKKKELQAN